MLSTRCPSPLIPLLINDISFCSHLLPESIQLSKNIPLTRATFGSNVRQFHLRVTEKKKKNHPCLVLKEEECHLEDSVFLFFNRTSLVVQRLGVLLPMQGTWVQSLVQEDSTGHGETKSACHNYGARAPQLLEPECREPTLPSRRSQHSKKPIHCSETAAPNAPVRGNPRTATKTQCNQK